MSSSDLTLVIGNKNYSSWSLRPWIFLKQFNVDFKEKRVALFTNNTDQQLESYGSNFKVPVLQQDDLTIWDSLSILEYVSERFLQGKGWPARIEARAFARSMSAEMHSSFTALRKEMPMNCRKKFEGITFSKTALEDVERIKQLWNQCHQLYGNDGPWLAGQFSIVDAMYIPIVLRLHGYNIKLEGFSKEYVSTVLANKFVREWVHDGEKETEVIAEDEISIK